MPKNLSAKYYQKKRKKDMEDTTNADYEHVKRVCKDFEKQKLVEYRKKCYRMIKSISL